MKKLACIALLMAAATMAGCMYGSKQDCCGEYQARCCGWEFYKPCDLIEGKRANCCPDPCCGEVVVRKVIVHEAPAEEAPAAPTDEAPAEPEDAPDVPDDMPDDDGMGDPPAGG